MAHKENYIIKEFINGTLDKNFRLKISREIKNIKQSDEGKIMENNSHKFDADAAWNKFQNRINNQNSADTDNKKWGKSFYKLSKIAASVILIISISVSAYFILTSKSAINIQSDNILKTVTLPDGSLVTLNIHSHLSYPEKFAHNNRIIEFDGEAFFNISKNPQKPFIIKTDKARIKVLGTSFNVNTDKKKTEVVVKTGKVEFKNSSLIQNKVVLTPGEKGILSSGKIFKMKNENPNYLSWKTHFFTYDNEKLKIIVSDINEAYQVNIMFKDGNIGEIVTGKTSFNNYNIETIIKIICETHHLKSTEEGKNIILSY
ncbi:MAG: FecR family protein [Bacteroidales bacterium]|nr:FecR family protein [Bacteroidales bacterium]